MYSFHCKHPSREKAKALSNQARSTSSPSSHGTHVGGWELEPRQPQSLLGQWGALGRDALPEGYGDRDTLSPFCHAQRQCLGLLRIE